MPKMHAFHVMINGSLHQQPQIWDSHVFCWHLGAYIAYIMIKDNLS